MAFTVPLLACVCTFIRILEASPRETAKSIQADRAILELGAGYYARLELSSEGNYAVSFVRDLVRMVERFCDSEARADTEQTAGFQSADPSSGKEPIGTDRLPSPTTESVCAIRNLLEAKLTHGEGAGSNEWLRRYGMVAGRLQ